MNREELIRKQAPLKSLYADQPTKAICEMTATGTIDFETPACHVHGVNANEGMTTAGLHPMAGGSGAESCSGDMLLQSLVACSGVTLAAVATAIQLTIKTATVRAIGVMDFRGTLGVDRETPVGLQSIRMEFLIESDAEDEQIDKLIRLVERYCVVLQTLKQSVPVASARVVR